MAFSDFNYPAVLHDLRLTLTNSVNLFPGVPSVPAGSILHAALPVGMRLGSSAHTDASRAIWMVGPLLLDFWQRYAGWINLIAGADLPGDPDAGLIGEVDFILCRAPQQSVVVAPVVAVIFEAKRDNIADSLGRCIAGMAAAQRFNQRAWKEVEVVYGCVTTGTSWRFLELVSSTVTLDLTEYHLTQSDKLLGILTHIVGPVPEPLG